MVSHQLRGLFSLFLLPILIACGEKKNIEDKIVNYKTTLSNYGRYDRFISEELVSVKTEKHSNGNESIYIYNSTKDQADIRINFFLRTDSVIDYNGIPAILYGTKKYRYNDSVFTIHRYYFDEPDSSDDNCYLFVSSDRKLIAIYSIVWDRYLTFGKSKVNDLLMADTTYFKFPPKM